MNMTYSAARLLITNQKCDYEEMTTNLSLFLMTKRINQDEYKKLCTMMDEQHNKVTDETQAEA
ncbi:hypothetical protein [Lysinibacillus parviboronicapiens]|uniref:hypothetical protein n=1 Tax=Lysinibacillus parviboronicapiens TaxID=436516 RepID=UPI0006CF4A26|nr:hypothetical protein [Lysinibacillus parviboronicapiens]